MISLSGCTRAALAGGAGCGFGGLGCGKAGNSDRLSCADRLAAAQSMRQSRSDFIGAALGEIRRPLRENALPTAGLARGGVARNAGRVAAPAPSAAQRRTRAAARS